MNIAVLGYGTVGKSVCEILSGTQTDLTVAAILRRPGSYTDQRMTSDFEKILADPSISAVVDVLPGTEPSLSLMRRALCAGKHVVTANKAALCASFSELWALASEHNVSLRFEASCGGTLPIIEEAFRLSALDPITEVSGILNGTCNYILWQMEQNGWDFADALHAAQERGFAEADPTADISGTDVRNKAVILASTTFCGFVSRELPVCGIAHISKEKLDAFAEEGKCLRLMMLARRNGNAYAAGVVPVVLPKTALEAHVPEQYNLASLTGAYSGELKFYGQGAGGHATADAVIRDLLAIERGEKLPAAHFSKALQYDASLLCRRGYLGSRILPHVSLEELCKKAAEAGVFAAFEPNPAKV